MVANQNAQSKNRFADHTAVAAIVVVLDMLSAQLADIAKDEFIKDLREQVSTLAHATTGTGGAIRGMVSGLKRTISNIATRVRCKSNEDLEAAANSERTVREILDQLTEFYARMRTSLTKAASMSRQLNMDIFNNRILDAACGRTFHDGRRAKANTTRSFRIGR